MTAAPGGGSSASRGQRVRPEDILRRGPVWSRPVGWALDHVYWSTAVTGAEHVPAEGPVIIASNHTGVVDGPVMHGAIPRGSHFLVKQEFFDSRIGFLMRWAGQIPVDRASGRAALVVAQKMLEEGRVVGIFPEGNRGRGDVASARAGVAWLAVRTGAPVVPAAILGTRPTGKQVGYVPPPRARLHVVFGAPIDVSVPGAGGGRGAGTRTRDGETTGPARPAPAPRGRAAMEAAVAAIRDGLADHVRDAVRLTGVELPADGPDLRA